jgi:hypothetical protein
MLKHDVYGGSILRYVKKLVAFFFKYSSKLAIIRTDPIRVIREAFPFPPSRAVLFLAALLLVQQALWLVVPGKQWSTNNGQQVDLT